MRMGRESKQTAKESGVRRGLGIWVLRERALPLGRYLAGRLDGDLWGPETENGASSLSSFSAVFAFYDRWVLVMATGIAVRYARELLESKHTDPGIVVVDEVAQYAVSLTGGHEGGANRLAYAVSQVTQAIPVVTTASEAERPLIVGIGCRKGVSFAQIDVAVGRAIGESQYGLDAVREVATIDVKRAEPGLVEWCERRGVDLRLFCREQLRERPWVTERSDWVEETLGVPGVCEPCALLAAPRGRLIVPKRKCEGVAVAVACDRPTWEGDK